MSWRGRRGKPPSRSIELGAMCSGEIWLANSGETANWVIPVRRPPSLSEKVSKAKELLKGGATIVEAARGVEYATGAGLLGAFRSVEGRELRQWLEEERLRETRSAGRLEEAEKLILRGGFTLPMIASLAGYPSHRALERAFQKVHGTSPCKWRRKQ